MSGAKTLAAIYAKTRMLISARQYQRILQRWVLPLFCFAVAAAAGCDGNGDVARVPTPKSTTNETATFVGREVCADCHVAQTEAWRGSHHDLAMQHATPATVLGDFQNSSFEYFGTISRFTSSEDGYFVSTDNSVGIIEQFKIAYAFGVDPLQQYLVEFPDGRIQALPIAWDVENRRWIHLYAEESITHDDRLHWTGREQNWNFMCAECHSTGFDKKYDLANDSFASSWQEIDVSCEACHGPASRHIDLAASNFLESRSGFDIVFDDRQAANWQFDTGNGIAHRVPSRDRPSVEPELCGRCHSRRSLLSADYEFGRKLLDTHEMSLLDEPFYYADGQIREEVYVYGSFLQSKMYEAGVTCSDCHDPHSAKLRVASEPSNICLGCHAADVFAVTAHSRHDADDASCVDCHMPQKTYMVVDERHDHGFRVPLPQLSERNSAPNVCTQCHDDRSDKWAAEQVYAWYETANEGHFSSAFVAAQAREPGANADLLAIAEDTQNAGIVRASALSRLQYPINPSGIESIRNALSSSDPLLRLGALRSLSALPSDVQVQLAVPHLQDSVRANRLRAFDVISPFRLMLQPVDTAKFQRAEQEYVAAQLANADRPEALANIAGVLRARGDDEKAEAYFRLALQREPRLSVVRANFADHYRQRDRDNEAEAVLRDGLELDQNNAALRHALGLLLVRKNDNAAALKELQRATDLSPDDSRFAYVYAVALNSVDRRSEAIAFIASASRRMPAAIDLGILLANLLNDDGRSNEALAVALDLKGAFPANSTVDALIHSLEYVNSSN